MIDTVILTIQRSDFRTISAPGIPAWNLYSRSNGFEKRVKNETPTQKKDGIYRPRVRGITRGRAKFLQMEFSVPKLLFGNNLDELSESDFPKVISELNKRLAELGIIVSPAKLKEATVSSFHPSKNIHLKNGYTSSFVISELSKINLTRRLDLNKDNFRNEGQSIQCYANSHSFVMYDKIQDLNKTKKRAVDKDQTAQQLSLFTRVNKNKELNEVLRFEVRLSKKVKMNSILTKLGHEKNPTFSDIFKNSVCQQVVELYWKTMIEDENLFLFNATDSPVEILKSIFAQKPAPKAKQAIFLLGLSQLCKDEKGIRGLRQILDRNNSSRSWYRLAKEMRSLNRIESTHSQEWVQMVQDSISKFEPLRIHSGPDGYLIKSVTK